MINAWYAWSLAVDDALSGYRDRTLEELAQHYAKANGVPAEEMETVKGWINWEEIEKFLKERDAI